MNLLTISRLKRSQKCYWVIKVEKYLDRCVESIVNQTYKNLEIILVDDGSPDKCPQMCEGWAEKDNRIKVVHKENGGLSDARNAGMKIATGEYISFVDSDDWLENNTFELSLNAIDKNDCDVCSFGVKMVWDNGDKKCLTKPHDEIIFESTETILERFLSAQIIQTVWNKIYKKSIIENFEFPVGKIYEDEFWSWKVMVNSNRIVCIDDYLYNYYQNDQSIMHGGAKFKPIFVVEAGDEKVKYIAKHFPRLRDLACEKYLYSCLFLAQRAKILLPKKESKVIVKQIKEYIKGKLPSDEYLNSFGIKKKIRIKSIYFCFGFVCNIQNLLNIGNESNI